MPKPILPPELAAELAPATLLVRGGSERSGYEETCEALFLTSGITKVYLPYWGAYSASKAALEALVRTYAAEIQRSKAKVNLFNPGPLRTRMRAEAAPGEDPATLKPPEAAVPDIVRMLSPDYAGNGVLFDLPRGKAEPLLPR